MCVIIGAMTYKIEVVVQDGNAVVDASGDIPDGVYTVSGTPGQHGPEPSVRFTRPENYTGSTRPPEGRESEF